MNGSFLTKILIVSTALSIAAYLIGVDSENNLIVNFLNSALKWTLAAAAMLFVVNLFLKLINSRLEKM